MKNKDIVQKALELGATKANVIEAGKIETACSFRDMCAANACGMYGKSHMCPPDVGGIDELMAKIREALDEGRYEEFYREYRFKLNERVVD